MKAKSILFILLLSVTTFSKASTEALQIWSLQDCIDYAMEHNIDIRLQLLNEEEADYSMKQSQYNFLPDLNANLSHGYSFGRSVDPFTNEFSTERIMRQNAYASSSVVLFSGFQNMNNMRQNLLMNTAARYDTESLQNEVILTIASAYMQILYSEDYVETTTQQLEILKQQLERTRALFEGGNVPRGNVLEMEARVAEEELNLITAENNLRMAYLELIQLLDLDPSHEFLVERPDSDVEDQWVTQNPEDIFEKALQVQPSVKAAETRKKMAAKQIKLERGRLFPTLALNADLSTGYSEASMHFDERKELGPVQIGYLPDNTPVLTDGFEDVFTRKPYQEQMRDNFSQYVGLSLRIPIFNRREVRTRIQYARVDLERSRKQSERTRNNLNKAIQQAHADALAAFQKYQATTKSLDAFREAFHYTSQRFDLGMVSTVEYNESQARLASAQTDALQAKYDFIFKMKIMEFYMGEGFNI